MFVGHTYTNTISLVQFFKENLSKISELLTCVSPIWLPQICMYYLGKLGTHRFLEGNILKGHSLMFYISFPPISKPIFIQLHSVIIV